MLKIQGRENGDDNQSKLQFLGTIIRELSILTAKGRNRQIRHENFLAPPQLLDVNPRWHFGVFVNEVGELFVGICRV